MSIDMIAKTICENIGQIDFPDHLNIGFQMIFPKQPEDSIVINFHNFEKMNAPSGHEMLEIEKHLCRIRDVIEHHGRTWIEQIPVLCSGFNGAKEDKSVLMIEIKNGYKWVSLFINDGLNPATRFLLKTGNGIEIFRLFEILRRVCGKTVCWKINWPGIGSDTVFAPNPEIAILLGNVIKSQGGIRLEHFLTSGEIIKPKTLYQEVIEDIVADSAQIAENILANIEVMPE